MARKASAVAVVEDNLVKGTQNVEDIGAALLAAMASTMTLTFE